jgi:hypothetical protein
MDDMLCVTEPYWCFFTIREPVYRKQRTSVPAMFASIQLHACICMGKEISGESARSGRKLPPCSRNYYPTMEQDVHPTDRSSSA